MAGTIAPPEKVDAILSMRGYADGTLKKEVAFKLVDEEKGGWSSTSGRMST